MGVRLKGGAAVFLYFPPAAAYNEDGRKSSDFRGNLTAEREYIDLYDGM